MTSKNEINRKEKEKGKKEKRFILFFVITTHERLVIIEE